jgi:Primase X
VINMNYDGRKQARKKSGTIIEGVPPIPCIFCTYMTSIEFDLDIHLYEDHRIELVKLPIGKGNMEYRIKYAIEEGKKIRNALSNLTPKARDSLVTYKSNNSTDIRALPSSSQVKTGSDFILSHFDEPLFPRTIMTHELGRQVKVFDRQSTLDQFKRSNYYDCRINAYSSLFQQDESLQFYIDKVGINITIIVIDLDLKDFNNSKEKLDERLQETLKKIKETIGGCPTVLDTGNGYHIYQPINSIILDDIDELKRSVTSYHKYYLPNRFLKYAEQYFTDSKSDPQHNPTVNSCLMRIPGTMNSKCNREVSILQEWDYRRPSIEPLLSAFKKYLSRQQGIPNQDSDFRIIHSSNSKSMLKQNRYAWIDVLLGAPLRDYRKYAVWRILAPYLIVVKQLPYGECFKIIRDWLDGCNCVEQLRFNADFRIGRSLQRAQFIGYKPIRVEILQQENPSLYTIVMNRMQAKISRDNMGVWNRRRSFTVY